MSDKDKKQLIELIENLSYKELIDFLHLVIYPRINKLAKGIVNNLD